MIPSNDFSFYDQVLDTAVMVGAIPAIYGWNSGPVPLATYFAMARGAQGEAHAADCGHAHHGHGPAHGVPALEMTKWFDTNYHYMVPELTKDQKFTLASRKPIEEYEEARALGYQTRPVLVGPVTFLKLAKSKDAGFNPLSLLERLLPVYIEVLRELAHRGAEWVQIDEPCLVLDLDAVGQQALHHAYAEIAKAVPQIKIMLATYFGGLGGNRDTALALPVAGLHLDLVRAPDQLDDLVNFPKDRVLSLGVIDGRNIWRADLSRILDRLEPIIAKARQGSHPDRAVVLAAACPDRSGAGDRARSRHQELAGVLGAEARRTGHAGNGARGPRSDADASLKASDKAASARKASPRIHDAKVATRVAAIDEAMRSRAGAFVERTAVQRERFNLPAFPTTTIGSFPQTADVRNARAAHAKGTLTDQAYKLFLQDQTARTVHWQESIGLDVLVHGEFERNDMVQYFGEQLAGFAFTANGWVQSYGSRYVRPPVLFGDVSRPKPMTVEWWQYAQSLTKKPMKAMLTGPVTILNWSFVRDDIPRSEACRQIALAIRDEVADLEAAGAGMIQIDEAALREGLPLRKSEWKAYLDWAVDAFRLCSSGVRDETQIHTHMCYSEFNDIIDAIGAMDADVISIETSRSKMELLDAFRNYRYPNEIGPGVYDIHSPRVPEIGEMTDLLTLARRRLSDTQLWINPDCGLKTRKWAEVRPALVNMVAAARELRASA